MSIEMLIEKVQAAEYCLLDAKCNAGDNDEALSYIQEAISLADAARQRSEVRVDIIDGAKAILIADECNGAMYREFEKLSKFNKEWVLDEAKACAEAWGLKWK